MHVDLYSSVITSWSSINARVARWKERQGPLPAAKYRSQRISCGHAISWEICADACVSSHWTSICMGTLINRLLTFYSHSEVSVKPPNATGKHFPKVPPVLSQDSVVGIATAYGLDDRGVGVRVPVGVRIFSSSRRPDRLWGPPSLLSNGYRGLFTCV
jgi:hypothetical protein